MQQPKKRASRKRKQQINQDVEKLLKDVNLLYHDTVSAKKQNDKEIRETVFNMLTEYFDSFALFGYDVHGNRRLFTMSPNDASSDALFQFISGYVVKVVQQNRNNNL